MIFHGGGITGITQWNDTDLHLLVEQRLLALEEADFHQQLCERPHKVPTRTRQSVLSDVAAIWATTPHHERAAAAAARTGLGVALPELLPSGSFAFHGSEDHLVTREAAEFWQENEIPRVRRDHLGRILRAVESGELHSWHQVSDYLIPEGDDAEIEREGEEIGFYDAAQPIEEEELPDEAADEDPAADEEQRDNATTRCAKSRSFGLAAFGRRTRRRWARARGRTGRHERRAGNSAALGAGAGAFWKGRETG